MESADDVAEESGDAAAAAAADCVWWLAVDAGDEMWQSLYELGKMGLEIGAALASQTYGSLVESWVALVVQRQVGLTAV